MQIRRPLLHRPRIIKRPAIQRMRHHARPCTPAPAAARHPRLHQLRLRRTRRRHHSQRRTGRNAAGSHHSQSPALTAQMTSPTHTISAGPSAASPASFAGHTVRCGPPSAIAVKLARHSRAAPSPQPTKHTSPSPTKSSARTRAQRSETQSRPLDSTRTNSTFVPCGNSGLTLIFAPNSCHASPCALKSSALHQNHKVRIPHIHHRARNIAHTIHHNRPRHHPRHAHLALNQITRVRQPRSRGKSAHRHASPAQPPSAPHYAPATPPRSASHCRRAPPRCHPH